MRCMRLGNNKDISSLPHFAVYLSFVKRPSLLVCVAYVMNGSSLLDTCWSDTCRDREEHVMNTPIATPAAPIAAVLAVVAP